MSDRTWTDWETQRPINAGYYWWRIEPRMIGGMTLQPEWVDELTPCGMGYRDSELWPVFSRWDGYTRTVPQGTQWAAKEPTVANDAERWPGVDLLPCPFCCAMPAIRWAQRSGDGGIFVGSRPYQANDFMLTCRQCRQAETRFCESLIGLTNNWNKRAGQMGDSQTFGSPPMSEVQDAVIRLTAWLRDYGHQCNMPTFAADIAAVIEAAKHSPEWRDSAPMKAIERFSLEWFGLAYMQSQHMANDPDGDWCRWEDVKAVFDLCGRQRTNGADQETVDGATRHDAREQGL